MISSNQITVETGSLPDSQPVPTASWCRARARVWLVDDDREVSLLMAALLSAETGFDCSRRFTSAAAMLEALGNEIGPEVILLDIQLGPENGLEAIRPIKAIAPDTRVLMLTSFYDRAREHYARNEGASDLLLKSYPAEEIAHRIRQALERPPTEVANVSATRQAEASEHLLPFKYDLSMS